ncbi:hypothetical protein, partial [Xenorhabdus bovienii]
MDAAGVVHRYWIRTSDDTLIKPNLAPPENKILHVEASEQKHIPVDLVLVGSIPRSAGAEVFFFYSKKQKALFRQEGSGHAVLDANHSIALR